MSATHFALRDFANRHAIGIDVALAVLCLAMLALMAAFEYAETIPYHVLFLAVALVYGFRVWPLGWTLFVVVTITMVTGLLFSREFLAGRIGLDEMSEIPLMPMLLLAMVWHARRRDAAMRQAEFLADQNRDLLERERDYLRDTSHAIRTPVSIAQGYVDLALTEASPSDRVDDLLVVARQLARTQKLSARLLRLSAIDAEGIATPAPLDAAALVQRVQHTWAVRAPRSWSCGTDPDACVLGNEAALEDAIDALLENAIHHTTCTDRVRVTCRRDGDSVLIQVADSGPGITEQDLPHVFNRFWHVTPPDGVAGSGLGLAIVESVVTAHGGRVAAGRAPEGGALFTITLPAIAAQNATSRRAPAQVG